MKVLMCLMGLDIGGAETHVVELCRALASRGIDISVASSGGVYVAELESCGIKHFTVPLHNKNPKNIIKSYFLLKRIIKDNKFDVVHAHARIPAYICSLLKRRLKFPFVTTAHWVFVPSFPWNILTKWGDKTLAVSEDIRQYLIDNYNLPSNNITVTINGIDTEKFSRNVDYSDIAAEFDFSDAKNRIVYVSRMDESRSLAAHKLIECVPALCRDNPDLEVVIVGDGDDFDNVKRKADEANGKLGRRAIIITGGRTDINKFIASATVFVGVSRAALEAMAAEVPTIIAGNEGYIGIFDKSTLQAAMETNLCCRGCGDTTTEKLEKDIRALLDMSVESLKEISEFGQAIVANDYSVERMANDAFVVYKQAITENRPVDVLISGYYGYRNSGDDALLKAMISSLRELKKDISITVLSQNPQETAKTYGVNSIYRFDFPKISRTLKQTKLLISGGGSLIQDITSNKSLMYYLWIIKRAVKNKAKVMLYSNGIGPIVFPKNRKRVAEALRRVDCITLRDENSRTVLEELGISTANVTVTADPAFYLESATSIEHVLDGCGIKSEQKYCVISIRPWKNNDAEFEQKLAQICSYAQKKHGILPLFIPMQQSVDFPICDSILKQADCGSVLTKDLPIEEILGIISRAEFIIGMRLHTLIYAASMGVPVVGLVYDPKVGAFMDDVRQSYKQNVENVDVVAVQRYIDEIVEKRDEISEKLALVSKAAKEKALKTAEIAIEML